MENTFDLKKFLVENKLTTNSRLVNEAHISPEGNLEDLPDISTTGNKDFDEAFTELLRLASDSYGDGEVNVENGLENLMEMTREYIRDLERGEGPITAIIDPVSEINLAFLNTIEAAGETDSMQALQKIKKHVTELWKMYL